MARRANSPSANFLLQLPHLTVSIDHFRVIASGPLLASSAVPRLNAGRFCGRWLLQVLVTPAAVAPPFLQTLRRQRTPTDRQRYTIGDTASHIQADIITRHQIDNKIDRAFKLSRNGDRITHLGLWCLRGG